MWQYDCPLELRYMCVGIICPCRTTEILTTSYLLLFFFSSHAILQAVLFQENTIHCILKELILYESSELTVFYNSAAYGLHCIKADPCISASLSAHRHVPNLAPFYISSEADSPWLEIICWPWKCFGHNSFLTSSSLAGGSTQSPLSTLFVWILLADLGSAFWTHAIIFPLCLKGHVELIDRRVWAFSGCIKSRNSVSAVSQKSSSNDNAGDVLCEARPR